jgi:hypothetical protein
MFDGFEGETFSSLCVQAKNLKLYIIDTYTKTVINTIDGNQTMLKSIFRDQNKRDQHHPYYEGLKELVEKERSLGQQEFIQNNKDSMSKEQLIDKVTAMGNTVLIPKLNEEFIAIRIQHTLLIKIYDIKRQKYVRQFLLEKGEDYFDIQKDGNLDAHLSSSSCADDADSFSERSRGDRRRPAGLTNTRNTLSSAKQEHDGYQLNDSMHE